MSQNQTRKVALPADHIEAGIIIGVHGLQGHVRVKGYLTNPNDIDIYGPIFSKDGQLIKVTKSRVQKGPYLLVKLEGVDDRNAAEALKGTTLCMSRAALPPLERGEYYYSDLMHMRVSDTKENYLGRVKDIQNFGAGDILEIELEEGKSSLMIPFTHEFVPIIYLEICHMTVDLEAFEEKNEDAVS